MTELGERESPYGVLGRLILGGHPPPAVPDRVREAIRQHQDTSEVLVCLVQLAATVTFAGLYEISPKAFPPDVPFEPVPWTLGFYLGFTLIRLYLAWRRRLGRWFLAASVIVDVTVLMVTIWSFHLQYDQPAGIYLKAPTLMYAFILIALRALRFEAGYILLAGATAAVGWLALVAYAVYDTEMSVTRSYAEYMTSYSILLGAEFDKVISIVMVTGILAVVILRARWLLITSVAEQQAARNLSRFFEPDIAASIRSADVEIRPGQGVTRDGAVVVFDIRGFTPLSARLTPDQTITLLGEYQTLVVPLVRKNGGTIDKYMGDGIMATFGVSRASATYAADAMRAVDEVMAAGETWQPSVPLEQGGLHIHAAVTAGSLVFGAIGEEKRLEYTVIGDAVNLATKLEKHTRQSGHRALADAKAYRLAEMQGYDGDAARARLENCRVDGIESPLDLIVLA
jgi:adenylate cyclase